MEAARTVAAGLALARVAFGAGFIAAPERGTEAWVGPKKAKRPARQVFGRALGARDLVLGLVGLDALRREDRAATLSWLAAHTLADSADFAATFAVREKLPRTSTAVLALAGGSAAAGVWCALALGRGG